MYGVIIYHLTQTVANDEECRFHPRKWDTTKTLVWSLSNVVKYPLVHCHMVIGMWLVVYGSTMSGHRWMRCHGRLRARRGWSGHRLPLRIFQVRRCFSRSNLLIPAWISNHIYYKVWDVITYPFPNFNGATVEVWEWVNISSHAFLGMWLLIHVGIKSNPC